MNTNNIIGGLMTARLNLSLGCRQSSKLKEETIKASVDAGAMSLDSRGNAVPTGSISVNAKLWRGSDKVMGLQKKFVAVQSNFKSMTLPWGEGVRIFRAERINDIYRSVRQMIDDTDPMIEDIVKNYDAEAESAMVALGKAGRSDNYPQTGESFRDGIVRQFHVDTLSQSNKIVDLVGGELGTHLAREHEEQLRRSIGEAQQDAADRLADVLQRLINISDPSKDSTRVTNSLFEDIEEITTNMRDILLFPNPALERMADTVKNSLSHLKREDLAKNKDLRHSLHGTAKSMAQMLGNIPIV